MITRLTDRIELAPGGGEMVIARFGCWGTTAEIERRGRKWFVVYPGKKKTPDQFKTKEEAVLYIEELARL
jgi:hypothetical protein